MFPVLLPAIEKMLIAAKENKVFEVCPKFSLFSSNFLFMDTKKNKQKKA